MDRAKSMLIGGQWCAGGRGTFDVVDPATLEVIAQVADASPQDAVAAVDAASAAAADWAATAPRSRSDLLMATRSLMLRDVEALTDLVCAENGKSRVDARAEVIYAAEFFRWFAEEGVRPNGDFGSSPAGGTRTIVTHRPVGVAALVTPWNFPAAMATRKIAPALAAGCTVVLKPAAETPLTAIAVAELMVEAGLPAGVVNLVPGLDAPGIVAAWTDDPRVRKISFTGSTAVGRQLLHQAADRVVNTSMELGGNAPFVVTADADLDAAVEGAMIAKFRGGGQVCTAANRFFVHADVAAEFAARFGTRVEALLVGPAAQGSDVGPLISDRAVANVHRLVDAAVSDGAKVAYRALPASAPGHFFTPAVLTGVSQDSAIVREEIFGPVAPIVTWTDTEDMLAQVNATEYGLAAYVFAGDLGAALRLAERIEAGMVAINRGLIADPSAPFGGVKQSGIGREGARAGLEEFTETQYFSVAW